MRGRLQQCCSKADRAAIWCELSILQGAFRGINYCRWNVSNNELAVSAFYVNNQGKIKSRLYQENGKIGNPNLMKKTLSISIFQPKILCVFSFISAITPSRRTAIMNISILLIFLLLYLFDNAKLLLCGHTANIFPINMQEMLHLLTCIKWFV